ncbi:FAD-dependent oxidoreductase [Bacillaceae bacterium SIJ1]|uniref:dihydrolipoyl dehydrogenase family protein n=1 Tax=Litoribacterium kuwaitense TaxID=1398745 RepID=UPI0013EDAB00|nr:FAD-dependent oxidoreductase [Litoribacterium kuwaitense]NGP46179.1 FAD-dependent oxidoreductase [Litoribacterium kuwaitense]
MNTYDVAIIGAGAGGLNAAFEAVQLHKKVVLIDQFKPGGECTWSGCIPSKALIQIAKDVKNAQKFGSIHIESKQILEKVRHLIETAHQGEAVEVLEDAGITYVQGSASFKDANTLMVNDDDITADKIVISTGSSALVPPINGLENVNYLTNETVFLLEELPKELIVLGGGAIGVELSQAMQRLGVQVKVVEMAETILPREEKDMAQAVQSILQREGVAFYTSAKAVKVKEDEKGITLTFEQHGQEKDITAENMLVALGRKPNTAGLNLDQIGVTYHAKGIEVNEYYETSVPNVYAVGDVVGPFLFSHTGGLQGKHAMRNAFSGTKKVINFDHVAWCTFTEPELARSGMTEAEAREKYHDRIAVYTMNYSDVDRAVVDEKTDGMAKVICDDEGLILGASILGERACEMLCELQILKSQNIPFYKLQEAIHPYPGYSELLLMMSTEAYNHQ